MLTTAEGIFMDKGRLCIETGCASTKEIGRMGGGMGSGFRSLGLDRFVNLFLFLLLFSECSNCDTFSIVVLSASSVLATTVLRRRLPRR